MIAFELALVAVLLGVAIRVLRRRVLGLRTPREVMRELAGAVASLALLLALALLAASSSGIDHAHRAGDDQQGAHARHLARSRGGSSFAPLRAPDAEPCDVGASLGSRVVDAASRGDERQKNIWVGGSQRRSPFPRTLMPEKSTSTRVLRCFRAA